jgi:hypothetical protein
MVEMFGLNRPVAGNDRGQAELEHLFVRHRDHEEADGHDHRAEQDRALVADHAIGDVAAEDGRRVHQCQVGTVGLVGRGLTRRAARVELRHDVEHQCPADAVEGEPFPELGHEQHPQRTRMAHHLLEFRDRCARCCRACGTAHAVFPCQLIQ